MASVNQVLVISPEKEHHEKITAAMNRCGLLSICFVGLTLGLTVGEDWRPERRPTNVYQAAFHAELHV